MADALIQNLRETPPPPSDGHLLRDLLNTKPFSKPFAWEYLEEHLFFGPEVTFSSDILVNWDFEHTISDVRTLRKKAAQFSCRGGVDGKALDDFLADSFFDHDLKGAREFSRFIREVIQPVDGFVQVKPNYCEYSRGEGFAELTLPDAPAWALNRIHTGNSLLSALLKTADGRWLTLNLEPSCIEVNQAPCRIRELAGRWKPLMERAAEKDFCGSPALASGGGGGHVHLSFGEDGLFPFLNKPDLLARFLAVPSFIPGLLYAVSETGDRGPGSTCASFGEWLTRREQLASFEEEAVPESFKEYLSFLYNLISGEKFALLDTRDGYPLLPAYLLDHDAAFTLKNFPKALEARIFRAFNSFSDLEAAASFLFHLALKAGEVTFDHASPESMLVCQFPTQLLKQQFRNLCREIKLPNRYRQRLGDFGGDRVFAENRQEIVEPVIATVNRVAWQPGVPPCYDIEIPERQFQAGDEKVQLTFVTPPLDSKDICCRNIAAQQGFFRLMARPGSHFFAVYTAWVSEEIEKDEGAILLDWGFVEAVPRADGFHDISILDEAALKKQPEKAALAGLSIVKAVSESGNQTPDCDALLQVAQGLLEWLDEQKFPDLLESDIASVVSFRNNRGKEGDVILSFNGCNVQGYCYQIFDDYWYAFKAANGGPGPGFNDILSAINDLDTAYVIKDKQTGQVLVKKKPRSRNWLSGR